MEYPALRGRSILVVEDEVLIGMDIRTALEEAGAHVTATTTVHHALILVEHDGLAAAIIDHALRDGDSAAFPIPMASTSMPRLASSSITRAIADNRPPQRRDETAHCRARRAPRRPDRTDRPPRHLSNRIGPPACLSRGAGHGVASANQPPHGCEARATPHLSQSKCVKVAHMHVAEKVYALLQYVMVAGMLPRLAALSAPSPRRAVSSRRRHRGASTAKPASNTSKRAACSADLRGGQS